MTKEERDAIRAEVALNLLPVVVRADVEMLARMTDEDAAKIFGDYLSTNAARAKRAEWVVTEANALIAELSAHEEAEAALFPTINNPQNMTDAEILARFPLDNSHKKCAHNIPIAEACAECEASHAELPTA